MGVGGKDDRASPLEARAHAKSGLRSIRDGSEGAGRLHFLQRCFSLRHILAHCGLTADDSRLTAPQDARMQARGASCPCARAFMRADAYI